MCASASLSSDSESNFGRKELNRHLSNANGFRRRFSQSLDYRQFTHYMQAYYDYIEIAVHVYILLCVHACT